MLRVLVDPRVSTGRPESMAFKEQPVPRENKEPQAMSVARVMLDQPDPLESQVPQDRLVNRATMATVEALEFKVSPVLVVKQDNLVSKV